MRIGTNSRMDTIQAAVLIEKLKVFADEIECAEPRRRRYARACGDVVDAVPVIDGGQCLSVWAQYTIEHDEPRRPGRGAEEQGVPTAVYYPDPDAPAGGLFGLSDLGSGGLPVTNAKAGQVISLPMHPYLTEDDQDQVIAAIRAFNG
jgi:dTDP-4-amino-4,6-dideoxygalactose transaminase